MDVTIYSTQTCQYCQLEKEYLASRGTPYREVSVDRDMAGLEEMVRLSGQLGVPFTVIRDGEQETQILGFDPERLEAVLESR